MTLVTFPKDETMTSKANAAENVLFSSRRFRFAKSWADICEKGERKQTPSAKPLVPSAKTLVTVPKDETTTSKANAAENVPFSSRRFRFAKSWADMCEEEEEECKQTLSAKPLRKPLGPLVKPWILMLAIRGWIRLRHRIRHRQECIRRLIRFQQLQVCLRKWVKRQVHTRIKALVLAYAMHSHSLFHLLIRGKQFLTEDQANALTVFAHLEPLFVRHEGESVHGQMTKKLKLLQNADVGCQLLVRKIVCEADKTIHPVDQLTLQFIGQAIAQHHRLWRSVVQLTIKQGDDMVANYLAQLSTVSNVQDPRIAAWAQRYAIGKVMMPCHYALSPEFVVKASANQRKKWNRRDQSIIMSSNGSR